MEKISKREQNKVQHRQTLVDAARRLFVQRGFEGTAIDDIVREAQLTKRTLYQYFLSKEDLFYAVRVVGAHELLADYEQANTPGATALERLRQFNQAFLRFYIEQPDMFRLLSYQPANQANCKASPSFRELEALNMLRVRLYAELVVQSREDGSINPALDLHKALYFGFFGAFSLLNTASTSDRDMWAMIGMREADFLQFSFDLVCDVLQPPPA